MRVFHPGTPLMLLPPPLRLAPCGRRRVPLMWTYAVIIALSRVAVTAHFPSDVIAGAIFGVAGVLLVRAWFASRRLAFAPGSGWNGLGRWRAPLSHVSKGLPARCSTHKGRSFGQRSGGKKHERKSRQRGVARGLNRHSRAQRGRQRRSAGFRNRCAARKGATFEIVYVNDGSTDRTESELTLLMASRPWLRQIKHVSSYGQSAAVHTGVRHARAPVVVTLDGDGQNDPAFIPALLKALSGRRAPHRSCRRPARRPAGKRVQAASVAHRQCSTQCHFARRHP